MAEADLEAPAGEKKKSKMMLIIIAVVVLLAGSAGAYFFLFSSDASDEVSVQDGAASESEMATNTGGAVYVGMPRPFQFNAPGTTRERIVQIDVQLMVRGSENEERAKRHIPMIEGTLLRVFSASNADDLVTEGGKAELRSKSTAQVRQVMNDLEQNPVIEEVLFTGFVIQ
ncbi:flagellar basal body-associated protein FliL [Ningiella sp. W23]|uniref:flagellar basal body-associated protein FliL n=1 Tax=Ningiella sp. W23 TaxID=3023715 RepID=UPI003756E1AC